MMPLVRQAAPGFWAAREQQLLAALHEAGARPRVLAWQHESRSLADWFHASVRDPAQPRLCAYCDGALGETSAETIDHFFPQQRYPELALCWENLYPACHYCNQIAKRSQGSCRLLRPDVDLQGEPALQAFLRWFELDPESGRIREAPTATRKMRARVRLTLRVFQLNTPARCQARKMRWRDLLNALKAGDEARIHEDVAQGPYRFVAEQLLAARPALEPVPQVPAPGAG